MAARPDVAVIVGPNHFRGLWLDLMPAFVLGVGEVVAAGEHGTPEGPLPADPAFARELLDALYEDEFDVAFSGRLTIDHGITHAVQYLLTDLPMSRWYRWSSTRSRHRCPACAAACGSARRSAVRWPAPNGASP